jgi:hypothetical protein
MKKVIGIFLVLFGLTFAMPAQSQIKFGFKGGLNLSKATFSENDLNGKNATGFFVGPMLDGTLPGYGIGMDVALLFSKQGLKGDGSSSSSVNVRTVDIPLNLKYNIGMGSVFGIFFAAGPQFSFNRGSSRVSIDNVRNYTYKSSIVSFNLGAGIKILNHYQLGANYNLPFETTASYISNTHQVYNFKMRTLQFSVAYLF